MKTANEIFEDMKGTFVSKTGYEISDDCDMAVRMYAAAGQIEALYIYDEWITRQCFPQTAEGEYLDRHCALRGLERKSAVKATGEICFTVREAADREIEIPLGTVCINSAGVGYVTTAKGTIGKGETMCTVAAEAVDAGKNGNTAAGTVVYMTNAPIGVEQCTNFSAFIGGKNVESDDELRERLLYSYKNLSNGANAAWYEKTALEISDVTSVSVISCPRGAGSVDVYIASRNGLPDAALISKVQSVFDEKRELCTDVQVLAPTQMNLNISVEVKVKSGYKTADVLSAVKMEIFGLFAEHTIGKTIYLTELGDKIYHVPGVETYRIITPDYDYSAGANVLLKPGDVTVSRWG